MRETLTNDETRGVLIASGSAHPALVNEIAHSIGTEVGAITHKEHPNSELYVRYQDSVRGKHVFIVQPHIKNNGRSVNDAIMEQCLLTDAARSSSAREITVVVPYFAYSRQDRKSKGREPIGTRVVIDQLASAGADRIVTVDMHSSQSQAIFRGPFDHLTAQPLLRDAMRKQIAGCTLAECIVVAPDAGAAKMAEQHQAGLKTGMFIMSKFRDVEDSQRIKRNQTFPEADGKVCMLFDDMVDTAGTLVSAAEALKNSGATKVFVAATHGVLSDPALARLADAPIDRILVTDTFTTVEAESALGDRLEVVSVAPTIGRAILEIVRDGSVSEIFSDQNHR